MPVDFAAGRHYGLVSADPWTCPACDAEQTGPVPDGCTICGAGKPGRKVEQPIPAAVGDIATAFSAWLNSNDTKPSYLEAFTAGYGYAMSLGSAAPPRNAASTTAFTDVPLTPVGVQARTLAAALALFIEQILVDTPEEIASGEWLDLAAARDLLAQLQADGRH